MRYFMQVVTRNTVTIFPMGTSVVNDDLAVQAAKAYMTNNQGVLSVQILSSVATVQRTTDLITVYDRNLETSGKN